MAHHNKNQQFVLLPLRNLTASRNSGQPHLEIFLLGLHAAHRPGAVSKPISSLVKNVTMRVLDSIHENGVKLVELPDEQVLRLRAAQPGLRIVPVVYYQTADCTYPILTSSVSVKSGRMQRAVTITVVDRTSGQPLKGATVVGFTDYTARAGVERETNAKGQAVLRIGSDTLRFERLYVLRDPGYWGLLKKNVTLKPSLNVGLRSINLSASDGLHHYYGTSKREDGNGVKVAIVDSGVAPHEDLDIDGGRNTVTGEAEKDFGDNGIGHGTHVAGIVAGQGTPPNGIKGVAPGVTLRSYRVFGKGSESASNFSIAKAIDRAVADDCDVINLSLGGGATDDVVLDAVADARSQGAVVVAATGNDGRQPVSFPASLQAVIAVSAFGRKGLYPKDSPQRDEEFKPPHGDTPAEFVARFSNIGGEVDFTGPGVGIVSTYPGGYAAWNGTSMACPAVTGAVANLLAQRSDILGSARNQDRSDAIVQMLVRAVKSLGFGKRFEGYGRVMI